ncbi:MAG: TetR/AcrR family transcriptional regulator [Nocardioidaceae bacterium]
MTPAKDRVREAAVRLFATKGFHGTGIRDLAQAADLSSATLYHYMGTKEDLLVRIMTESLQRLVDTGRELKESARSPRDKIGRLVQLHVITHALQQEQTIVVDNELRVLSTGARKTVLSLRDEYEALWRDTISEGCAQNTFQVPDQGIVRLGLLELCTGVARWYSPSGALPLTDITQAHVRMAYAMLGVRPSRNRKDGDSVPPVEPVLKRVSEVWGVTAA